MFFSFSAIQAQSLSLEHETVVGSMFSAEDQGVEFPNNTIVIENELTNLTDSRFNVAWERTVNDLPEGWTASICFGELCYDSGVGSSDGLPPVEILANGTLDFKLQVNTNGATAGAGNIVVVFNPMNNPDEVISSSFTSEVFATSIEELPNVEQEVAIYPNPVRDILNLDFYNYENVRIVEIYNMLGKVVERVVIENTNETKKIDLSALSEGMFFISLIDNNNQLIETKRFSKVR